MKICDTCNKIYTDNDFYCLKCNRKLRHYSDAEAYNSQLLERQKHGQIPNEKSQYQPKCPLCQSPKIRQISTVKRGVFSMTFGLLSTTARSQWECLNCGNKF